MNLSSLSRDNKTKISGNLNINNLMKERCEAILNDYQSGKKIAARKALDELRTSNPNSVMVKQLHTIILYRDGNFTAAYSKIRELLKLTPENISRLNLCGLIQRQLGMFDEAIESYQKAIRLNPSYAEPYNNMAIINRYYGEQDKAIKNFRKALDLDPAYTAAIYNLSCMKVYKPETQEIEQILKLLPRLSNRDDKVRCHFSLYNAYSKMADYTKAFAHLKQGNDLVYKTGAKRRPLSFYNMQMAKCFTREFIDKSPTLADFPKKPVFIIGMPRSGSSLLEQMLAAHPQVYGLGETKSMLKVLDSINARIEQNVPAFFRDFSSLSKSGLQEFINGYKKEVLPQAGDAPVYTDKMLKNFKVIGLIKVLLPNAIFFHIKRHPLDNCLSCYEKKFTNGHEYTYDLNVLGSYYADYLKIMDFWKKYFPEDIYDVQYENLVEDTETTLNGCLQFMQLEMHQDCLQYYTSERRVFTASTDQVREKINTASIGKWKHFEKQLQPLIASLKQGGIDIQER